jgi:hypothetical protein
MLCFWNRARAIPFDLLVAILLTIFLLFPFHAPHFSDQSPAVASQQRQSETTTPITTAARTAYEERA